MVKKFSEQTRERAHELARRMGQSPDIEHYMTAVLEALDKLEAWIRQLEDGR